MYRAKSLQTVNGKGFMVAEEERVPRDAPQGPQSAAGPDKQGAFAAMESEFLTSYPH